MKSDLCQIKINDEELTELYGDIISIEVEEETKLASVCNIRLAIRLESDSAWTWIDDERIMLWNKISVSVGFESDIHEVFIGYITHVKPYFDDELSQCYMDIKGLDESVVMNMEEKIKEWPNKKDSDIVNEIFNTYGFTSEVEDTEVVHDEIVSTIIQRESDIQFLKRLAERNGYNCYVRNSTGFFKPKQLSGIPQKVLAIQFGTESNLAHISFEINGLRPVKTEMHQLDLLTNENCDVMVDSTSQKNIGQKGGMDLYKSGISAAKRFIKHRKSNNQPAMQALCEGIFNEEGWLVDANGKIISILYQDVLRAGELVTLKGVGKTYSSNYYVSRVKHVFTGDGYTQEFSVIRNAIYPEGSEIFEGNGSIL